MDDHTTVHITSHAETYLKGCSGEMIGSMMVYVCGSHGYKYSWPTKTSYQTWDASNTARRRQSAEKNANNMQEICREMT